MVARVDRLRVLISAFACEPGRGSEPGVGWNIVRSAADSHDVWVVTHGMHRPGIEAELRRRPVPNLHFFYYQLPKLGRWRLTPGGQLYYYLWQLRIYPLVRRLHETVHFDVTHHATYVKYWQPSLLSRLPVPFVWGPVGGGESFPWALRPYVRWSARIYAHVREIARWCGEHDPLVRFTARRCRLALAVTQETSKRLRALGATDVRLFTAIGLTEQDVSELAGAVPVHDVPIRFVSIGRMLHLKGFHLGLQAFASARLPADSEYWLVGDGPEVRALKRLAERLGIADRVRFWGQLERADTLQRLGECHALVHPSMHESGGVSCLEAMAAGRPVICLDVGGPRELTTDETGFRIDVGGPLDAIAGIAKAMSAIATDPALQSRMGRAAQARVASHYLWQNKGLELDQLYRMLSPRVEHHGVATASGPGGNRP
jgi:glycosyltransferase involved in cell wall biosynthesis